MPPSVSSTATSASCDTWSTSVSSVSSRAESTGLGPRKRRRRDSELMRAKVSASASRSSGPSARTVWWGSRASGISPTRTPAARRLFRAERTGASPSMGAMWLTLEGAVNVRDLGGLPVAGGGATRAGVLVRADNLQGLSARDVTALEALGLKLVVDLRTSEEIELEGPGPLVGRVEIRNRSLHPDDGERTDVYVDDRDEARLVRMYMRYLRDRPDSIVAALRDVAHGDGAAIVHCAAGKDRTGMVVALALSAIGVERDAIVADYAATGERLLAILERLKASSTYAGDLEGVDDDVHVPRPETMHRVLSLVDARHGSPNDWLRSHGFEDFDALRARLT